jgi:hypothetical protein
VTIYPTTAALRAALIVQFYDEWHGYYMLQMVMLGKYVDVKPLSKAEALLYRAKPGEALRLVYDAKQATKGQES